MERQAERIARRNIGAALLLLGVVMIFLLSLAYMIRYDDGVVCRFTDFGEQCGAAPSLGAAKFGAWSSLIAVIASSVWFLVPRASWRRLLTADDADDGIGATADPPAAAPTSGV